MLLNADFSKKIVSLPDEAAFTPSPAPGVARRMLDRIGGEVARATSIVRYAPGSRFSRHMHGGGEEFLVLSGVFSDETGDFPAGTYVRNPIGTGHAPHSDPGCTLFVKLHQFDPEDQARVVINTMDAAFSPEPDAGVSALALHAFGAEHVRLLALAPGSRLALAATGGAELLVLEGALEGDGASWGAGTWVRAPDGAQIALFSTGAARIYLKTGHLLAGESRWTEAALAEE